VPSPEAGTDNFLNLRIIYYGSRASSQGEKFPAWGGGGNSGQVFLCKYFNQLKMMILGVFGKPFAWIGRDFDSVILSFERN
jgi:hypothetical protein